MTEPQSTGYNESPDTADSDTGTGLAEGQDLAAGTPLGFVGATGNADPTAPHLHFAVFVLGPERRWWEGSPLNPYPLMQPAPDRTTAQAGAGGSAR